jgi:plasmid stabilization system protein ParE
LARLIYSESGFTDFERIFEFSAKSHPELAAEVVSLIEEAVQTLGRHPLIGRIAESGMRELVVSYGKTGYIALYDFLPEHDVVRVLALRHQREAGYTPWGQQNES